MRGKRIGSGVAVVVHGLVLCLVFVAAYFAGPGIGIDMNLVLAGAVVLSLLLTVLFTRLVLSGGGELSKAAAALGGNPDPGLLRDMASSGELGPLSEAVGRVLAGESGRAQLYERVVLSLKNPVLVTDAEGRVILATQALSELVNKPMSQITGFSTGQVLFGKKSGTFMDEVLRQGKPRDMQEEMILHSGRRIVIRAFVTPIYDDEGTVTGGLASLIDLHALVAKEEERKAQAERMLSVGSDVNQLAQRVASAAEELSASADEQARGAQKQKGQTDTVAAAMEEMTATVLEVARNATATSEAANGARDSATEGVDMVHRAVKAIHSVSDSAEQLSSEVAQLNSQAGEIGRIIAVINDIADQTNLLALNAAIEAARAGEAGRGFAVVADEVRKLAEKTMTATKEVEQAIKTIQKRSRLAMASMDRTGTQVNESTDLSNKAGEALQTIMTAIEDMVGRVDQIASAAEEQSTAAEEINRSIEDIAQVSAEADEGAGQTAAATRDLAELAQELLTVSEEFSDKKTDSSKLRASAGEMRGVLPKLAQEYIREEFGPEIYDAVQEAMGHPSFLPAQAYPDQVLHQMAELVEQRAGISDREFFLGFGRFTPKAFNAMYPRSFKDEDLKSFFLRMNEVHAQLTKDQPGIKPPNFTYEDKGDRLFMNYRSKRGLFDYFEGILLGAAAFKGERVEIRTTPLDAETVRAEIRFLE